MQHILWQAIMSVKPFFLRFIPFVTALLLSQCADSIGGGSMGGPTEQERSAQIAAEARGDFFYGRRYFVNKTNFLGYLRKPGQQARHARLVVMQERQQLNPDRFVGGGSGDQKYGFDQNYEYRIWGNYTGRTVYDLNSNQFLPEFLLTRYEVVDQNPGWLFRPSDRYDPTRITLLPR
jgi:hypothetical protein